MAPVLQVWSGPKCQLSATPWEPLPAAVAARITETVGGTDDVGQLTVPTSIARAAGIDEGRVLRAVFPLRGVVEWLLLRVEDGVPGDTTSVTLAPLRQLLALRGFARLAGGASTALAFPEFSGTVADVLNARVLLNLADDDLTWLSLGTLEPTSTYTWPAQQAVRRGEVLTLIEQVTGADVSLRRLANDAGYAIDVLTQRNGTLAPRLLRGAVQRLARTRDLLQTATEVMPLGEDNAPMGEVDWLGGTPIGSGPFWIPLTDPTGGAAPIQEDGQCAGHFLALPGGTALPILASRKSDSAVQVASLGAYSANNRVLFWENATGRPLTRLSAPAARASHRGQVTAKVTVKGARAERTLNRNGDFLAGAQHWTPGLQGVAIAREDFGVTMNFLVNGARANGTGTGTPFTVDGGVAGKALYRGDQLRIAGVTHRFTAQSVPDAAGALSGSISPNLTATYPDDLPVTLVRREVRQWVKDGTTSFADWAASGGLLAMRDVDSDGLLFRPMTGLELIHDASGMFFTGNVESLQYTNGLSGAFIVNTSGGFGTPPAQFTDGDTFTAIFVRETRVLRFNGTQALGASSVSFKPVASLARRDWLNTDMLYARRALSAVARITAFNDTTLEATLDLGVSTIDEVASADRDGNARLLIDPNHIGVDYTVTGGSGAPLPQIPWIVQSISGSIMTMAVDVNAIAAAYGVAPFQVTITNIYDQGGWARSYTSTWTVVDGYAVTAGATWGSNGRATVPISVPAGRVIARGTPLYANWIGGGAAGAEAQSPTPLFAHAQVTGAASSIDVAGWDDYRSDWDGSTPLPTAVWRLFSGTPASSFSFAGEVLVVGTTTAFDGSGAASIVLQAANTTDIADNATVELVRPAMIPAGERSTGAAMRLLYAVSGPLTPGQTPPPGVVSDVGYVAVPAGETAPLTATARVVVQRDSLPAIAPPVIALVRVATNTVVASSAAEVVDIGNGLAMATFVCTATLSAGGLYAIHLYGGSNTLFQHWHVALEAQCYVGREALPFFPGARSRVAYQRAQQVLAQRQQSARYRVTAIDQAELAASGAPLLPGQPVRLVADELGIDDTQRAVRLEWAFPGGELVELECAAIAPKLTDVTVSL